MKRADDILKEGMPFDRYTLVRRLGKGGMASVWLAKHTLLNTCFAIKFMDSDIAKRDPEYIKRFLREARLAGKIHHPHIVGVYDVGQDKKTGLYYLVMEYVPGGNISQRLKHGGPLPERSAVDIVRQMAEALQEAQQYGMVHRDIKPDNIMFDAHGEAKLADLGIAKCSDPSETHLTQTEAVFGTPAYMSPEQARDSGKVDTRADIYSLGVVLFEMLSGKRPYGGKTVVEILSKIIDSTPPPDVRALVSDVSDDTVNLVNTMIRKDPAERFQNADDLLAKVLDIEERVFGKSLHTAYADRTPAVDSDGETVRKTAPVASAPEGTERTLPTLDTVGGEIPADGKTMPTLETVVTDGQPAGPADRTLPTMATVPSADKTLPSAGKTLPSAEKTVPSVEKTVPSVEKTVPSAGKTLPSAGKKRARMLLLGVGVFVAALLTAVLLKPNRMSASGAQQSPVAVTETRDPSEVTASVETANDGSASEGEASAEERPDGGSPAVSGVPEAVDKTDETPVAHPESEAPAVTPSVREAGEVPSVEEHRPLPVPSGATPQPTGADKPSASAGASAAKRSSAEEPSGKQSSADASGAKPSGGALPGVPPAAVAAAAGNGAVPMPVKKQGEEATPAGRVPESDSAVSRPGPTAGGAPSVTEPAGKTSPAEVLPDVKPVAAAGEAPSGKGTAVTPVRPAPAVKDTPAAAVRPKRGKVEISCLAGTWPVKDARVLVAVKNEPPVLFERGPYTFEMPENGTYSVTVEAGSSQNVAWRSLTRRDCTFEAHPNLFLETAVPVNPPASSQAAAAAEDREVTLYCAVGPVPIETAPIRVMVSGRKPVVFTAAPYTFKMPETGTFTADVGEGTEKGLRWKAVTMKDRPYCATVNVALERAPVKGFHVRYRGREVRRVSVEITASNMDRICEKKIPVSRLPQLIEECLAEDGRYKIAFSVPQEDGSETEPFEFGFAAHGTENLCFDLDEMQVLR